MRASSDTISCKAQSGDALTACCAVITLTPAMIPVCACFPELGAGNTISSPFAAACHSCSSRGELYSLIHSGRSDPSGIHAGCPEVWLPICGAVLRGGYRGGGHCLLPAMQSTGLVQVLSAQCICRKDSNLLGLLKGSSDVG